MLDEPTASLDVPSMKRLAEVVAALKAAGKTVVVSSTACGGWRTWPTGGAHGRRRCCRRLDGRRLRGAPAPVAAAGVRAWTVAEMEGGRPAAAVPAGAVGRCPAPEAPRLQAEGLTVAFRRRPPVLDLIDLSRTRPRARHRRPRHCWAALTGGAYRERASAVAVNNARGRPTASGPCAPGHAGAGLPAVRRQRPRRASGSDEVADAMWPPSALPPAPSAIHGPLRWRA
ncbi:MAG: hypothetical protein ACLUW6_04860 [Coriobacteriaceae bacterium]